MVIVTQQIKEKLTNRNELTNNMKVTCIWQRKLSCAFHGSNSGFKLFEWLQVVVLESASIQERPNTATVLGIEIPSKVK